MLAFITPPTTRRTGQSSASSCGTISMTRSSERDERTGTDDQGGSCPWGAVRRRGGQNAIDVARRAPAPPLDEPQPGRRPPCRRARPGTPHHARVNATAARGSDRRHLSAGAQIRPGDQPGLGRSPVRDRARFERAGQLFLRWPPAGQRSCGQSARENVPGARAKFCPDPERAPPGGAEPVGAGARRCSTRRWSSGPRKCRRRISSLAG